MCIRRRHRRRVASRCPKRRLKTPASHVARLLAAAAARRVASQRATGGLSAGWVTRRAHTRAARIHHGGHFRSLSCSFSRPSFSRPSCPPATRGRPSAHRGACVSHLPPYRPWGCLGSLREVMSVRRIVLLGSVAVDMWGFSEPDKQGSPPKRGPPYSRLSLLVFWCVKSCRGSPRRTL